MTKELAAEIAAWRYPGEYAVYDGREDDSELLDGGAYALLNRRGELVGFYQFGQGARIPTAEPDPYPEGPLDVGLGLRPDLCGLGLGASFLRAGLDFAQKELGAARFRLTVAAFNQRARKVYARCGFRAERDVTHKASGEPFAILLQEAGARPKATLKNIEKEGIHMTDQLTNRLFDFIQSSPTALHTVQTVRAMLLQAGFTELFETEPWQLAPGQGYFTTRSGGSVIAFRYPKADFRAFSIAAPHGDSPAFKVKGSPEMKVEDHYAKLNTEVYGGMALNLWLDRPLSVAGRLAVRTEEGIRSVLTDISRDLLVIPSLAIHMNREANQGAKTDPQKDTLPLLGGSEADLLALAAERAGVKKEDILAHDLYLYHRARGTVYGAGREFIAAPKLDDLECAFSAITAFLQSRNQEHCTVCAIFDNEETGSMTRHAAGSTFLSDVLDRICAAAGKDGQQRQRAIQSGMLLSADNAHAVHPNYPEKADPTSRCYMNKGVVVKHSTRYATDSLTAAAFKRVCEKAGVPTQDFYNHSSNPGGGTLGLISGSHVSIPTVDIGLAQLAMHSPYETAGREDLPHMTAAMTAFYSSVFAWEGNRCRVG